MDLMMKGLTGAILPENVWARTARAVWFTFTREF